MDIKTRLTRCCGKPVGGYKCSDGIRCPDCFDKLEGWREIERLREALEHIANRGPDGQLWNTADEMGMIARSALQQKESE